MKTYAYSHDFMHYTAQSSAYSAAKVVSLLRGMINVESVLDVGCAKGTWLRFWKECGVADIHGLDGDYVDRRQLEISSPLFTAVELNIPFNLGRQFDLVQSLEVGEHIEEAAASTFVDNLVRHARHYILFSAASPGQGGEHHINEKPYEFWRRLFEQRGFATIDAIRHLIADDIGISYWYRYNTMLYVRRELLPGISYNLRKHLLTNNQRIRDVSPIIFRVRKALVRHLPNAMQTRIASFKSKHLPTGRF